MKGGIIRLFKDLGEEQKIVLRRILSEPESILPKE